MSMTAKIKIVGDQWVDGWLPEKCVKKIMEKRADGE